ncbi:carboxypeptidase M32 [Magnetospira thiophila]
MRDAYNQLAERFRRILVLGEAEAVLRWDQSVMMPAGGAAGRAEQLAVLETTQHGLLASPDMEDLLNEAATEELDDWRAANLAGMRRMWVHAAALPSDLVAAKSHAASACERVWRTARAESDFKMVLPLLRELLAVVRQVAQAKSDHLGVGLYDSLLDEYEPDARSVHIDELFTDLGSFLPDFLGQVLERQNAAPAPLFPEGPFPVERQEALGRRLMRQLGFDFEHGRLDISLHPFCSGTTGDVRLTTRYDPADFTSSLMGVLHETGHALYDMGLPETWAHQPVGGAMGMSIHESQSLLIEMQVCRSSEFLRYAAPLIAEELGGSGPAWDADNLARLYTRVEPGFIRVDADEVTYPAHVILRYELEKALISGQMEVEDLPGAWNDGLDRLLGIRPPSDREGCLQDIHWYDGAWGYFPTYTLGAMTAAQLFASAKAADSELQIALSEGDFIPLLTWLRTHVHSKGCLLSAPDLLRQATGATLSTAPFKQHLQERYLSSKDR